MYVEGLLHPDIKGSMVETTVADVGPPLIGSVPVAVFVVVMSPLEGIPMMMVGKDIGPLKTIPSWKGSICTPTMGIDGVVKKVGSYW